MTGWRFFFFGLVFFVVVLASRAASGTEITLTGAGGAAASPSPSPSPKVTQAASAQSFGTSTATVTWAAQPTQGDVLVACGIGQYGATISATGWTTLVQNTGGDYASGLFYKIAGASEGTTEAFVVSSGTNLSMAAIDVKNGLQSAPQFTPTTVSGGTGAASYSTTAITPTQVGALPIACFAGGTNTPQFALPTNANTTYSAVLANVPTGAGYQIYVATGTGAVNTSSAIGATSTVTPTPNGAFSYQVIVEP